MAAKKKKDQPDFEQALNELEHLVEHMEEGDLSLEDSIKTYERGVTLGRSALKSLDAAEQRIQILNQHGENSEPQSFEIPET